MQNVHLVSRDEDTFTLTENSRAVASITGTPGWEAIFAGRPVIVFGNAYYRGAPGTVSVNDPRDLAARLDEINRGAFPTRATQDILRYLAAIDHCSYEGIVDKVFMRDSDLSEQQSIENYTAILRRLIASPESFDRNG
jgi:capsule polysaccharide export protein KpsC/LpsZ